MDRKIARKRWPQAAKVLIAAAVAAAVLALLLVLRPSGGRTLRVNGDAVVVSPVVAGEFDDFIPVRGRVTPLRTVYLDAIEGGRVEAIHVEDGATVAAGQLLVTLSNTALQLDVIAREAEVTEQLNNLRDIELALEQNRLEHKRNLVEIDYNITRLTRDAERYRRLRADNSISQAELDATLDELEYNRRRREVTLESQASDERLQRAQMVQLRESAQQLQRNLEIARRNLDALNVRAAVPGKLTAFDVEIGQSLSRGQRIGQIDDPSHYKLVAEVDEFYLGRVDIDQTATLNWSGDDYELRVAKTRPQVRDGRFEVELTFEGDAPDDIRRGQTLQTRLSLGESTPALLIPNGAFYQDTGGNWVFVVTSDGIQAVRRTVRLGRRNARYIEVLEGLEDGEEIISSPYTAYLDMDRLTIDR